MTAPRLLAIGLAAPERELDGASGAELAKRLSPGQENERLDALYGGCGVSRRGAMLLDADGRESLYADAGERGPTTAARLARYMPAACRLAERAARSALAQAEQHAGAITHLVTVSCTGAESPGLDHALIERLGLSPDISRTHVGFMGCHGAINGLSVAAAFARADPAARVLVACAEVCSLHYHVGGTWDQQVANAIFADGAACAVVGGGGAGPGLRAFGSRVFPGTADLMSWRVGDHGFEMRLSARVPGVLRRAVGPWMDEWLGALGLSHAAVGSWAAHPGGRDILEAVRLGLALSAGAMDASRRVLDARGNMSSGTVLWVLDALLRGGEPRPIVAMSFGPGLSGEAVMVL